MRKASRGKINNERFAEYQQNFYLTNAIARASKTMMKCVEAQVESEDTEDTRLAAAE